MRFGGEVGKFVRILPVESSLPRTQKEIVDMKKKLKKEADKSRDKDRDPAFGERVRRVRVIFDD